MKKRNEVFRTFAIVFGIIVVWYLFFKIISLNISEGDVNRMECPYKVEGNISSNLIVQYVDSPYCFWCWVEEPILKRMVAAKGNLFSLEKYDIRHCSDIVTKYGFSGTPSFVFALKNENKEFTRVGFIPEEGLNEMICRLSKGCENDK